MKTRFEVDELEKLKNKPEIFAPSGDFEKPAQEFVAGPYYASAEEVMPELESSNPEVAGDKKDSKGVKFSVDRRDFMRLFSLGAAASAAACVRRPTETAVPYVEQPVDFVPGNSVYYASTCSGCSEGCGILVKTREGRPVKVDGNPEHLISKGKLCAFGQAQLQALYHPERLASPQIRTSGKLENSSWDEVYQKLAYLLNKRKKVGIITGASSGSRHGFFFKSTQ